MSVASVRPLDHFKAHEAIMRERGAYPKLVPGVEYGRRQILPFGHQPPRRLSDRRGCPFLNELPVVALSGRKPREGFCKSRSTRLDAAEKRRDFIESVHPNEPGGSAGEVSALFGSEHSDGLRNNRGDVLHRLVAKTLA